MGRPRGREALSVPRGEFALGAQLGYEFRPEYLQFRLQGLRVPPVTARSEFRDDPGIAAAGDQRLDREGDASSDPRADRGRAVSATYARGSSWPMPSHFRAEVDGPRFRKGRRRRRPISASGPGRRPQAPDDAAERVKFAYAEADDVQVLEMTYRGDDFQMVVVLPRKVDGLDAGREVAHDGRPRRLDREAFPAGRGSSMSPNSGPTHRVDLAPAASRASGCGPLSTNPADFTGIVEDEPFWISSVIHCQAVVAGVDEEETERRRRDGDRPQCDRPRSDRRRRRRSPSKADHPFLYLIRDLKSGADPSSSATSSTRHVDTAIGLL